jgi:hypothetical protein
MIELPGAPIGHMSVCAKPEPPMPASLTVPKLSPRPLIVALGSVVVLLVATSLGLWAYYGTAVFYEMIVSGLATCF